MSYIIPLRAHDYTNLKIIFINLFGDDFKSEFNISQIQNLIEVFKKFDSNIVVELYKRQFHILYLIAHTLHKYNEENLKLSPDVFYEHFYFPNMISILSSHMKEAKVMLRNIVRDTYEEVHERCQDIVDFYLVFFNNDSQVIKNDILHIFLNTLFLEADPINIENVKTHYTTDFRYLLYSYLKNKTTGLSPLEVSPDIIHEDSNLFTSTRLRIYEDGIKITQIQELCDKSNTYNRILQNYNNIKTNVISNELQKIFLYITTKTATNDNRISMLSVLDEEKNLENIKIKLPLIYKLLRSLHITTKANPIDENFKILMYKSIYEVLFIEFSKNLSNEISINLANNISKKITYSLTSGQYIDPLTMDSLSINNYMFLTQLKTFLEFLVKNVNR